MTARKSAAAKRLAGTARPDRAPKATAAGRITVAPRPPAGLTAGAARHWRTLARTFMAAGVLNTTDLIALRLLAEALADAAEARATLMVEGYTILSGSGAVKAHPALRRAAEARSLATRLLIEFGSTPAARQRVETAPVPSEQDDAAEKFLSIKRLWAGSRLPQKLG